MMPTLPQMLGDVWHAILTFVFIYPVLMSLFWMTGGVLFYWRIERKPHRRVDDPPHRDEWPPVSVLVPCFNEAKQIEETIDALMSLRYPHFEVVAVNDGSTDNTGALLNALAARHSRLRVIHHVVNQGKAVGLNTAALLSRNEILVGIDGDARLDPYALHWLVGHFDRPHVGAVTGNPRVRNRSTMLGRIQVGEFSSIVGLIKRAQRSVGLIFTVSGVIAAFRRSALHEVGYWSPGKLTEDVDVSWRLQLGGWDVAFEPRALCWILMPETLRGLWSQRLRWSMGGTQVLLDLWPRLLQWRQLRLWPMFIEFAMSILWAFLFVALVVYRLLDLVIYQIPLDSVPVLMLGWTGALIGLISLLQTTVSMLLDRPYDRGLMRNLFWAIWYPSAYWFITAATAVVAVPKILLRDMEKRAVWTSPDRGVRPNNH